MASENSLVSHCQKLASGEGLEWEQVLRMGMVTEIGVGLGGVTQNGCCNGGHWRALAGPGGHWRPLSPCSSSLLPSICPRFNPVVSRLPCLPFLCCCFRPGGVDIVAASSCEHLTIFEMALIGNGNFMRPQTVSVFYSFLHRERTWWKLMYKGIKKCKYGLT